jgi:hypothetical protein
MIPIPPGSPPIDPAPVRTPIPVIADHVRFSDQSPIVKWLNAVYMAILFLLQQPSILSGLFADIPDATLYPENSRYWATDTTAEYINIYATPGDPTTASWTAM